jgi:glycosyltransferase involved in cell wall biosynthesis
MDRPQAIKLLQTLRAASRLALLLGRRRIDVVHLHASTGGSLLRKLALATVCRIWRTPYVAQMHSGGFEPWLAGSRWNRRLAGLLFRHAAVTLVLAERWVTTMRALGAGRVEVVPNAIAAPEREALERLGGEEAGREPGPARLLFLGRWAPVKGLDLLAAALAGEPAAGGPGFVLHVHGNGDRAWAESVLAALGDAAELGEWLEGDAKLAALARADALVAPSRAEGMPVALIEARAAGLAIVATDVGAVAEVLEGDPRAQLIPPGDEVALREALAAVIAGPGDLPAPVPLPDRFHAEVVVARLERLYREVAAR